MQCATLRAQRGSSRYSGRPLRAQAPDQGRRSQAADPEASDADVRDGHYRALPTARELGRGGFDRDVSGRCLGSQGRGHHRGAVGHAGVTLDGVGPNKKIYGTIEAWRNRPIEGEHPYVYLDGIVLKRSWAGEVRNVSLLVAIGVNNHGIGRFSASAKAPRRTRRAGAASSNISSNAASRASD